MILNVILSKIRDITGLQFTGRSYGALFKLGC